MNAKKITERDYIKANRRASREAEIENHNRPVNFCRVHKSSRVYDRKKQKADDKRHLPSLFQVGFGLTKIFFVEALTVILFISPAIRGGWVIRRCPISFTYTGAVEKADVIPGLMSNDGATCKLHVER